MMLTYLPNTHCGQDIKERIDHKIHLQETEYNPDDLEQNFDHSNLSFFLAYLDFPVSRQHGRWYKNNDNVDQKFHKSDKHLHQFHPNRLLCPPKFLKPIQKLLHRLARNIEIIDITINFTHCLDESFTRFTTVNEMRSKDSTELQVPQDDDELKFLTSRRMRFLDQASVVLVHLIEFLSHALHR